MNVMKVKILPHAPHDGRHVARARPLQSLFCILIALAVFASSGVVQAQQARRRLPGKVVLIRGALTVFSLGLDTLADKLRRFGLDAQVVPGMSSEEIVEQVRFEHRRNPNSGPLVLIGHSRGGELAADRARDLIRHRIAVDLIVVVDATHAMSVPPNVRRCINFFETNRLGVVYGKQVARESRHTKLHNININNLPGRGRAGYIDHFNIDASDWLHDVIIREVVRTCQEAEAQHAELVKKSKNAAAVEAKQVRNQQNTAARPARNNNVAGAAAPRVAADLITPRKRMELRR